MHMGMANTVVRHPREVVVDMLGRVMVLLRDLFSALRVVLSRELLARTIGREVVIVVPVVVVVGVVVGTVTDSLLHQPLLTIRPLSWQLIPLRRQTCLARRWMS